MARALEARLAVVFALVVGHAACDRKPVTRPSASRAPKQTPVVAVAPPQPTTVAVAARPSLPEDPIAGKRSEQQWREHMAEEEHERQSGFDKSRLKQHRALVRLIVAARGSYDRAATESAVTKTRTAMAARIAEMRKRVTEIDPWGVNSRLLADYSALEATLADAYPDAKAEALRGHPNALKTARASFDQHIKTITAWLKEVEEGEEER